MGGTSRSQRAACLATGTLLGAFAFLASAGARGPEERVVLPVVINQVAHGDFLAVLGDDDVLLAVRELEHAGVQRFAGQRTTIEGQEYVSLKSLGPDVSFALDMAALTLSVSVPARYLGRTVVNMGIGRPPGITYSTDTSAFLNYALNWRDFEHLDGFAEAGLNVGGKLFYTSASRDLAGNLVRGQTNVTVDRREKLQRLVLGDSFGTAGELGGGLFLAGVTVARNYDLDPYFIRFPTMTLGGAVTTPSTADIYVNGSLQRREALPPGQFDFTNLQLPTGSGNVQIVIRDAFGHERQLANPFYASTQLLGRGLQDYSYSLGWRRDNAATASADYGSLVFLGRHRFGWTDDLTPEGRLEAGSRLVSGGLGMVWRLGLGEFSADVAASRDQGQPGGAGSFAYRYVGRPLSVGLLVRRLSSHYANSSLAASQDRSTLELNGFAGLQVSRRVSVGGQYVRSERRDAPESQRISLNGTLTTQRLGSLFVSAGRVRTAATSTNEVFVGYSFAFAANSVASASYARQDGAVTTSYDVQKSLPVGEGLGYRLSANRSGGTTLGTGLLQYQGPFGRYDLEYDRSPGVDTKTFSVTGGLVAIGGEILPTRSIGDSFALVRVPGVEGVTALANNQPIGRTDRRGDVLVPSLLASYGNRLGIKDTDIPLDYEIGATEKTVAPPYRGGALVAFPVRRIQSIRGRILVHARGGDLIPSYGQLTLGVTGGDVVSPLGSRGEFDFENLPARAYNGTVEFRDGVCSLTLAVPESAAQFVDVGVVGCSAPDLQ